MHTDMLLAGNAEALAAVGKQLANGNSVAVEKHDEYFSIASMGDSAVASVLGLALGSGARVAEVTHRRERSMTYL